MAAPFLRPLATGEVLDTSFGLYRSLFGTLLTVALVCRTVPIVLGIYLQQLNGSSPMAVFDHWQMLLVTWMLAVVMNVVALAATTVVVSGAYLGHPVTTGMALRRAFGLIGPLALLSFLSGIAVFLGLVALMVPGIIIWSGLVLASAVLILEQPIGAIRAMSRSWELTAGFRFKVFVAAFVAVLLFAVPLMVIGVLSAVGAMAGFRSQLLTGILGALLQVFVYPFLYVVITVLYYDLRVRKEGFDLELLATATHPAA
jgi:hypothetical protein